MPLPSSRISLLTLQPEDQLGDYEIQVFIPNATNRDMSVAALLGELYP